MGWFDGDVSVTSVAFHPRRSGLCYGRAGEGHPAPLVTLLPMTSFYVTKGAGRLSEQLEGCQKARADAMGRTETLGGTPRRARCIWSRDPLQSRPSAVLQHVSVNGPLSPDVSCPR